MMHAMMSKWSAKMSPFTPLFLRLVVGVIFIYAGWAKLQLGNAAIAGFFGQAGIPAPAFFAFVVTWLEMLGGIALILGFWVRPFAKVLSIIMIVATIVMLNAKGFADAQLPLVMLASCFTIFCLGGGKYSVDGNH